MMRFGKAMAVLGLAGGMAVLPMAITATAQAETLTNETAPQVSAALLRQGRSALDAGTAETAIDLLEQAVVAHPRNAEAYSTLGEAHAAAGDSEKARKYYAISLSIEPNAIQPLLLDGLAAIEAEDMETAQSRLERLQRVCESRCAEYRQLNEAVSAAAATDTGDEAP